MNFSYQIESFRKDTEEGLEYQEVGQLDDAFVMRLVGASLEEGFGGALLAPEQAELLVAHTGLPLEFDFKANIHYLAPYRAS
ncbi:hypothetical protein [Streptomyces sp. SGAir0957]